MSEDIQVPVLRNDEETLEERMTENAYENILRARYLQKNEDGEIVEEQEDLFERVAKNVAVAEAVFEDNHLNEGQAPSYSYDRLMDDYDVDVRTKQKVKDWAEEFQEVMEHLKFIPNTPTLINAGTDMQQLSACFVDSPADDMEDIHETAKEASLIFQSGGGVGYDFGNLRPFGDPVGSTGGIASGPITFMNTLDQVCETVAQGGVRRGAQMGTMPITHPSVIFFIHAKNKDVSLAKTLKLNDPDDPTHTDFGEALEEAREVLDENTDEDGLLTAPHLRNAIEGHLSNFNISVTVPDTFMEALEAGEEYTLINPRTDEPHIANEETKELYSWFGMGEHVEVGEELTLPAEEIWTRIVEGAHENGEPGVMYIDTVNEEHSYDTDLEPEYEMTTSNPCAEQNLMEYEACNLGHINLSTIVDKNTPNWRTMPDPVSDEDLSSAVSDFLVEALDWEEFNHRIELGTRFLDNVVTMSDFPIEEISETVRRNRKIGLGIMGLAQLFIQLGVEYGSEVGNEIARQLMMHINHESKYVSHELAVERGVFDNWWDSKYERPREYEDWMDKHVGDWESIVEEKDMVGYPIRNHNTTTIAPTGTTSMIGNTTGGCEPIYNVAYYKNVTDDVQGDEMLVEFDSLFLKTLEENDLDVEEVKKECVEQMEANEFDGVSSLESVPDAIGDLFVTTDQLDSQEHADVMCALQDGVDSSISKTLNAPQEATVEDAKETFEYVYENGGKSVTFYRDGSRTKQVKTTRKDNQETEDEEEDAFPEPGDALEENTSFDELSPGEETFEIDPRDRPDVTTGVTHRVTTGYGNLYVTINEDERGPVELFAEIGKSGGTLNSFTESVARMVSLAFRAGLSVDQVVEQLEGIHSPNYGWDNGDQVRSIPDGIATALERYQESENDTMHMDHYTTVPENAEVNEEEEEVPEATGEVCLECGADLIIQEGCQKCSSCGWSRC